ncbi:amidase [Williamsia sp. CHRR-6]|uniref:amidase n=1 Tax=Williamsia sp. CHRR-6 TaxID=2835871 RepID=UPI0027DB67F8|nr:amidase [Williamsia sp. CHRR-6]
MTDTRRLHAFTDDALGTLDATGVAEAVAAGAISCEEAVSAAIDRAEAVEALGAVAFSDYERARGLARSAGVGVFAGVPTFIKDNTDYAGLPCRNGSLAVPDRIVERNAAFTDQFLSTGLICLGKSAMPEFGFNASTEFADDRPPTRNPWDINRSSGASSGGSAALVAAGVVPIAHANDGGGSIRIPAAACGLVGLKLTRNREVLDAHAAQMPVNIVSNGALTRTVRDTAAFVAQLERYRPAPKLRPVGSVTGPSARRLRVGVMYQALPGAQVDVPTTDAVSDTAHLLSELGHHVTDIGLPLPAAELERFADDFAHYWKLLGFSLQHFGSATMAKGFDGSKTESLTRGLAASFARSFWRTPKAVLGLRRTQARYHDIFADIDVLVSPVLAHITPELGHLSPTNPFDVLFPRLLAYVAFTPLNNASGGPAISLPLGRSDSGLPIGVQVAADHGDERTLLELAYELEAARPFARITDA